MPTSDLVGKQPALRWWQYLGPWPLSPLAVAILLWMSTAAYEIARLSASTQELTPADYLPVLIRAIPAALAAGAVLWLFSRMRPPVSERPVMYWLAIASTVATLVGVRYAMGLLPSEAFQTPGGVVGTALARTFFTVVVIQSVIGVTSRRLAIQADRTRAALLQAREQQEQMVEADERVRAQVSSLLHDRVQAGLIASCLELLDTADRADPTIRGEITEIVHRLEELRDLDVRRAARALSPDLSDTDLLISLDTLGFQYAPSMLVTNHVSAEIVAQATKPDDNALLGCYRIVEQALLNAAVHGRARHCHVDVSLSGGELVVTVDDDGSGLPIPLGPAGLGSALTTTWVRILGGRWSREPSAMGGVRVRAVLPARPSQDERTHT